MILLFTLLSLLFPQPEATIVFAGDAMQHKGQLATARRANGTYDYTGCFDAVKPWVSAADYAVVNLETTLSRTDHTGYPCFSSPPAYAAALRDAGFDLFLTANNHTLDRRDAGLRRTVAMLDSLGVDHIGTYADAAQRSERMPLVKDINGFRVGFVNCTYGTNGIRVQGNVVVDYTDRAVIAADIKKARAAGAELVFVLPHWGVEYQLTENASQRALADFILESGADAVVGGHPHVIQPMHLRPDSTLVIYSLGNFVSDMKTVDTRGGAMASVKLARDDKGRAYIKDASYRLVFTVPGIPGQKSHRLVTLDTDTDHPNSQSRAFAASALRVFNTHNTNVTRFRP